MMTRWLVLLLLPAAAGFGQELSQEQRKQRLARYKQEQRAHQLRLEDAAKERAEQLAARKITGVARLGEHGDPARCADIVFIGDGFADDEQGEYNTIIDRMAKNFATPPFDALTSYVNLYRVNLVSEKSGIAVDDNGVEPPLGGTVSKFVGGKLLRCNVEKVLEYVRAAVPDTDYVLLVLNTHGKFLGSANSGRIVRLSTSGGHQRSIVVHEFGHNFVGLIDEYVDKKQSGARAVPPRLKYSINAGLEKNVYVAKWHHFNIPEAVFRGVKRGKAFKLEDNVRCYEGAATFVDNVYRAEENCHMQRGRGRAFCRLCTEGVELGMYRFLTPIESVHPYATRFTVGSVRNLEFRVVPLDVPDPMRVAWYLDGKRLNPRKMKAAKPRGFAYRLGASEFGPGEHFLTVQVHIDSPRVRMDRGRLSASFTWTVVTPEKRIPFQGPRKTTGVVAQPLGFETGAGWSALNLPEGASHEAGRLAWTPARPGGYRLEFANGDARESVAITIKPAEKRRNKPPRVLFLPDQVAREGETFECALLAYDADGDHLAWTAKDLPPRARLHPSGRLTWDVGYAQRGSYALELTVTDGPKRTRTKLRIDVAGAPLFRGMFNLEPPEIKNAADWMLVALHHPLGSVRLDAARKLAAAPRPTRVSESLRLLRERDPMARLALENLQAIFAGRGRDHLDMFLDEMPRRIWQFVDRPQLLEGIAGLCKTALGAADRKEAKQLDALRKDIELIEAYNKDRRERDPKPPITDKKYR